MTGTAVVAMRYGERQPADVSAVVGSVRTLVDADWSVVLMSAPVAGGTPLARPGSPDAGLVSALTLALGQTRAGRRAIPVVVHTLVDPLDPALAHRPGDEFPEPVGVLEAEAIAALLRTGFPVVVAGDIPVVPFGDDYRPVAAVLDEAASARRLAGDLGASVLVFVVGVGGPLDGDGPPRPGEIDVVEAEKRLSTEPLYAAELRAAVRFVRAGGELAVLTPAPFHDGALDGDDGGAGMLRIHRRLARPRSETPALAAGWC